ncbi:MAG: type III polyketide synthase [Verrucomicrobia bacterium]|nr:type III polyketide synthase [Verrucomicrobiota bacterium]MCH8527403.1 type III polyketide synthase [Kiritimatiellia bacterium]
MPVYLHAVETWTPPARLSQSDAAEQLATQLPDKRARRIVRHIYKQSAIDTRHTCIPFDGPRELFAPDAHGQWRNELTGDRNQHYIRISKPASIQLARQTLQAAPGISPADITHVITASCTGFYTPGPDHHIVQALGLAQTVERFHLGFMGCYAAFPALRMANTICRAHPDAVVLIQCLELCSLHVQLQTDNPEALVASSLFADGGGCALVSTRPPATGHPGYQLQHLATTLVPAGEHDMAWNIGNHGFDIVLSAYVPHILGENIRQAVLPHLDTLEWPVHDIGFWAVHPGGKAILDRISDAFRLPASALDIARGVLRTHGNMSSATLFFLLKQGLSQHPPGTRTAAMAFGPGLTVETALMQRITP